MLGANVSTVPCTEFHKVLYTVTYEHKNVLMHLFNVIARLHYLFFIKSSG